MDKFELGPKQKQWIAALKSGRFQQFRNELCGTIPTVDKFGHLDYENCAIGYCCLGVAMAVLKLKERSTQYLDNTFQEIGLNDERGSCRTPNHVLLGDANTSRPDLLLKPLADLNDDGRTFEEIADILEKFPEYYFDKSV